MAILLGTNTINKRTLGTNVLNKIMLGITQVFPSLISSAWSPQDMFLNGEQGAWWDYYDNMDHKIAWCANNPGFTPAQFLAQFPNHALFQDAAGTVPVTAVEQSLGLVLDKSKGLATTSTAPLDNMNFVPAGSTPPTAANTTFLGEACGSITYPINAGGFSVSRAYSPVTHSIIQGYYYRHTFSYALSRALTGGETLAIYTTGDTGAGALTLDSSTPANTWVTSTGRETALVAIANGNNYCCCYAGSAIASPVTVYIRQYVSIQVAGNHLIQATAAARPVLSARKNQLLQTESFDNATWSKTGYTVTPNQALAPDGKMTADLITVGPGQLTQAFTAISTELVYTLRVKNNTMVANNNLLVRNSTTSTNLTIATINWVNMTVTGGTIEAIGDGWHVITLTVNAGITVGDSMYVFAGSSGVAGETYYAWGAQLEHGSTATRYQRVTTATDYDTMGFSFYRSDDGIDDGMATAASVNMSSTDKLAVFVGDANGNTANTGTLIESSPTYLNNAGSFALLVPSLSTSRGSFGSNGGLGGGEKEIQEPPIGQYRKRVITAYNDFATDGDYGCDYIRTNGIPLAGLVGAGNTDVGAGPYGNHTFYTGSRNNTSNRFKGHVHQMVVLGRTPTQEELDHTEGYIFEKQWKGETP